MDTESSGVIAQDSSILGLFDIILLGALGVLGLYWLLFLKNRNKNDVNESLKLIRPSASVARSESSFIDKMKHGNKNIIVFYGSQTGTAEEFAGRLAKEAVRYGMKGMVADPEECEMEELSRLSEIPNAVAIFCVATYGEGDPTDNAQEFHEWLQNGDCELSDLNYAVFGLGNKTYEHFNAMGRYVDKRLEELGAFRVFPAGEGDDDANIEEDFITWKDKFWPSICSHFGIEPTLLELNLRQYKLLEHSNLPVEKIYTGEIARLKSYEKQRPPFDAKNPYLAKLLVNRELHKGGERSCMHIEFDLSGGKLRYDAGDHVAIYPMNDSSMVEKLAKLLSYEDKLDQVISLINVDEDSSKRQPFPCPCSYRTALLYYLDITSPPRTHILKEMLEYCSDPQDRDKLSLMSSSSSEGKLLYSQWVLQDNRNIVHILEDLPSCKPPLDHLIELLPRLQARYYSISSSPKMHPSKIHITAVLVQYTTPTGRLNKGVATNWLALKKPDVDERSRVEDEFGIVGNGNDSDEAEDGNHLACLKAMCVPMFVRKSQFRLPSSSQIPIIMIGPGTGLAPFRGFLQEKEIQKEQGKTIGQAYLYFGCRHKSQDFIYQEELESHVASGVLTQLYCAFSRDQEEKIYVTHLLSKNGQEVWDVLKNGGHVYVCGDARNMAKDVHNIITNICQNEGGMTLIEAQQYVKKLETQRRYSTDVWS